jgi:hypothetical protein
MARQRGPIAEYFWQVAVAADRLLNALTGGSSDETLSSRAHRMRWQMRPYWTVFANCIDRAFFWQRNHCAQSWRNECNRRNPASEGLVDRK